MTGLNFRRDTILSIACLVTDHTLELLDSEGFEVVIHHDREQLEHMSDWCKVQHGRSGLTEVAHNSTTTAYQAADSLLTYIKKMVPEPGVALLAGNSIHADRVFLNEAPFTCILEHLHYRLFDVSSLKEAARRWAPLDVLEKAPTKRNMHTAMADIQDSLNEAKYYRDVFF